MAGESAWRQAGELRWWGKVRGVRGAFPHLDFLAAVTALSPHRERVAAAEHRPEKWLAFTQPPPARDVPAFFSSWLKDLKVDWEPVFAEMLRPLEKGSPVGDLLALADVREADGEREQAAVRLARNPFSRRYLFDHQRWAALDRPFAAWRGGRSWQRAWADLVAPLLLTEYADLPAETPIDELFQEMRRRLRRAVEVELLGYTTDSRASTEARLEGSYRPPDPADVLELAAARMDVLLALRRLPRRDAALLGAYYDDGVDRPALARSLGVTYPALRKRVQRVRDRFSAELVVSRVTSRPRQTGTE